MIGFGEFGKKREREIVSLKDERLVFIDPSIDGFFDKIFAYVTECDECKKFIEAIKEIQEAYLKPFWKPIYDPSLSRNGKKVIFEAGKTPAFGGSYNLWKERVEEMPAVENRNWKIGTEYQYYAFLVYLINQLVETGWEIDRAVQAVVIDSKELGHYRNSENTSHIIEETGNRGICGVYDLANTSKILACSNQQEYFWIIKASYECSSRTHPLADLTAELNTKWVRDTKSVGWIVL